MASTSTFRIRAGLLLLSTGGLIVWGAVNSRPTLTQEYRVPWQSGEQVLPAAVPSFLFPLSERGDGGPEAEARRAVEWGESRAGQAWRLTLSISGRHVAQVHLEEAELARLIASTADPSAALTSRPLRLSYSHAAFLDDLDGDGDPLDAEELLPRGQGIVVWADRVGE